MATPRKRVLTSGGKARSIKIRKTSDPKRQNKPWIVSYFDQKGKRHQPSFRTRHEAQEFVVKVGGEVRDGTHTPSSTSLTVTDACELWLRVCKVDDAMRPGTLRVHRGLAARFIIPRFGHYKLANLTTTDIEQHKTDLIDQTTRKTAKRIIGCWNGIFQAAMRKGCMAHNPAAPVKVRDATTGHRLGIGIDVPTDHEVRKLIQNATESWRPMIVAYATTGMRDGELRALRWSNVFLDSDPPILQVRHSARARSGDELLGPTKTPQAVRDIPIMDMLVNILREWRPICPRLGGGRRFATHHDKVAEIIGLIEARPGAETQRDKASAIAIRYKADVHAERVRPIIEAIRAEGKTSLGAIAAELNSRGIPTSRGSARWHSSTVRNLLRWVVDSERASAGISNHAVALQVGVDTATVGRVRAQMPLSIGSGEFGWVFPSVLGGQKFNSSVDLYLRTLQKKIGMTKPSGQAKYSAHSFRHFYASWLIKVGYPVLEVQKILGHKSPATTIKQYGHLFPDPDGARERLNKAEQALFAQPLQQKLVVLQQGHANTLNR
jgi:integrase